MLNWMSPSWTLFLAGTLSCCMELASGINIKVIPNNPKVRSNVTLSVTEVIGEIIFFDWYKGQSTNATNQILKYISRNNINGTKYFPQAQGQPNGSLLITDVQAIFSGYYTVAIQTKDSLQQGSVFLSVNGAVTTGRSSVALLLGVLLCSGLYL